MVKQEVEEEKPEVVKEKKPEVVKQEKQDEPEKKLGIFLSKTDVLVFISFSVGICR